MPTFNFTASMADPQRKLIQTIAVNTINIQRGWLMQFKRFGFQGYTWAPGGKAVQFLLDSGANGGAGFSTDDGQLGHLGKSPGVRATVNLPSCLSFARATVSQMDISGWQNGGTDANYLDLPLRCIQDAVAGHPRTIESILSNNVGDGRVATVSATTPIINFGDSGNITVDNKQYLQRGCVLTVSRSSSFISGVELQVQISNYTGSGEVQVLNQGTVNYTPTSGDIVYVMAANETAQLASLNECIGTAAFPPRGANCSPVDNEDYKATVGTADNNMISLAMWRSTRDTLMKRYFTQGMLDQVDDPQSKLRSYVNVSFLTYEQQSQISAELWGQTKLTSPQMDDAGWGTIQMIDGFPTFANSMQSQEDFYFVYVPGFVCMLQDPQPITTGAMGVYQHLPGTQNFEAIFQVPVAFGVRERKQQFRMKDVRGLTPADAGWRITTS